MTKILLIDDEINLGKHYTINHMDIPSMKQITERMEFKKLNNCYKPHICDIDACFRWLWIYGLHKKSKYSHIPVLYFRKKKQKIWAKTKILI
jgi:hypothetical protein